MRRPPVILLLFTCTLIVSCRQGEPTRRPNEKHTLPSDGGTLVRRLSDDVKTLNPVRASTEAERYVANYLFTPLIYLDSKLQPIPGLAQSWTHSPDGRIYWFVLDKRATFSDGQPVRARDVVFTLRKSIATSSDAAQSAGVFSQLDSDKTRELDAHTVEVVFREPLGDRLVRFNRLLVLPSHVYAVGKFRDDFNASAVGSGPYKLVRQGRGEIVIERREDYWRERPRIATVVFKVIKDDDVAWKAVQTGVIDETYITSEMWHRAQNDRDRYQKIRFERFYTMNYTFIAWNGQHPLFRDRRIRRALSMCVPTKDIIDKVYHGTARPLTGPFMPESYAYNPAVAPVPYDPAAAKQLLASLGWSDHDGDGLLDKDGKAFAFEMLFATGNKANSDFGQIFAADLRKIGVAMQPRSVDGATRSSMVMDGKFDAAYLSFDVGPEPDLYSKFHSSQTPKAGLNFVHYSNPEADRLITDAQNEPDRAIRQVLFRRLHKVLADDLPYTWIMQVQMKWAVANDLRGVEHSQGYGLFRWFPGEFAWWRESPQ